jgi:uncharacterized protein YdaU (DUF1376 family)
MKPPAFQCYADDLLAGTADMTAEEFGVYWRLICHSWNKGGLPNDDQRLALLAGQCSGNAVAYAKTKFEIGEDGLLRNARLEKVRSEQQNYSKMQSDKAHLRWDTQHLKKNGASKADAVALPEHVPHLCSPSPTPSPTPKTSIRSQTKSIHPKTNGLNLTFSMLERVSREIVTNKRDWYYDNHKLKPDSLLQGSVIGALRDYVGRVSEAQAHEAWQEAATRTHMAVVDGKKIGKTGGYAVECWKEQLTNIAEKVNGANGTH